MSETTVQALEDDDESFAEGDVPLEDSDRARLESLQSAMTGAEGVEVGPERDLAAVALLSELYGDDLEVR